jgi:anti-sigma B factor antagonist
MMKIAEEQAGEVTIIAINGQVDSNTAKSFEEKLTGLFKSGRNRVVVDFKHLAYITSAGFRVLLLAGKLAEKSDGKLALCNVTAEVRRVFDLGNMTDLFAIYPSREEGLAKLS